MTKNPPAETTAQALLEHSKGTPDPALARLLEALQLQIEENARAEENPQREIRASTSLVATRSLLADIRSTSSLSSGGSRALPVIADLITSYDGVGPDDHFLVVGSGFGATPGRALMDMRFPHDTQVELEVADFGNGPAWGDSYAAFRVPDDVEGVASQEAILRLSTTAGAEASRPISFRAALWRLPALPPTVDICLDQPAAQIRLGGDPIHEGIIGIERATDLGYLDLFVLPDFRWGWQVDSVYFIPDRNAPTRSMVRVNPTALRYDPVFAGLDDRPAIVVDHYWEPTSVKYGMTVFLRGPRGIPPGRAGFAPECQRGFIFSTARDDRRPRMPSPTA